MAAALHVAVFSKAPIPGQVKTRLIPAIGEAAATDLHQRLMTHTLQTVCRAGFARSLWIAGDVAHPVLIDASQEFEIGLHRQEGPDLGARMKNAMRFMLEHADAVALIGTDCPVLAPSHLQQVADALRAGHEVAVIPAEDGGYVLIGASRSDPARLDAVLDALFDDMPWSTEHVMDITRSRLQAVSATWHELPCLWDIDRPEDLARLTQLTQVGDGLGVEHR